MVYKKYIRKNGRVYGPYIYHSKRVDGKVVSEYHGVKEKKGFNDFKKPLVVFLGIGLFVFLLIWLFFFQINFQGHAVLDLEGNYIEGESLNAVLNLGLKSGELIPADSKLIIENGGNVYEYSLSELVDSKTVEGNFYAEGISLSGEGEGYGKIGTKKEYPKIYFKLKISSETEESETSVVGGGSESLNESSSIESSSSSNESSEKTGEEETPEEEINLGTEEVSVEEETPEEETSETISETESTEVSETSQEISEESVVESEGSIESIAEESSSNSGGASISESSSLSKGQANKESKSKDNKNSNSESSSSSSESISSESSSESSGGESSSSSDSESSESSSSSSSDLGSSSGDSGGASITGNAIGGLFGIFRSTGKVTMGIDEEIQGDVAGNKSFKYDLNEYETAEIVSGSVVTETENLSDDEITLKIDKKKNGKKTAMITTKYVLTEKGFGEEYLSKKQTKSFSINLSSLDLVLEPGELNIKLSYGDEEIVSYKTQLKEGVIEGNNLTEENVTDEIDLNETEEIEINETNMTGLNETNVTLNITNVSLQIEPISLTDSELEILVEEFGNATIGQTARAYKQWIIVKYSLRDYEIEYSYYANLSESVLNSLMENDKNNWLKDIANEISKESSSSTSLSNLTKSYELS